MLVDLTKEAGTAAVRCLLFIGSKRLNLKILDWALVDH